MKHLIFTALLFISVASFGQNVHIVAPYKTGQTSQSSTPNFNTGWINVQNNAYSNLIGDSTTDDGPALQALINAIFSANPIMNKDVTLYFPKPSKKYRIGNSVARTSGTGAAVNSQIVIPLSTLDSSDRIRSITFLGETQPSRFIDFQPTSILPNMGVEIYSSSTDSNAYIISSDFYTSVYGPTNYVQVNFENLTFTVRSLSSGTDVQPKMSCIDLSKATGNGKNLVFKTQSATYNSVSPYHGSISATGLKTPAQNNADVSTWQNILVEGFAIGASIAENAHFTDLTTMGCDTGVYINPSYHEAQIDRLSANLCKKQVSIAPSLVGSNRLTAFKIDVMDIEDLPSSGGVKWYNSVYDVEEADTNATGTIKYILIQSGTGQVPYGSFLRSATQSQHVNVINIGDPLPIKILSGSNMAIINTQKTLTIAGLDGRGGQVGTGYDFLRMGVSKYRMAYDISGTGADAFDLFHYSTNHQNFIVDASDNVLIGRDANTYPILKLNYADSSARFSGRIYNATIDSSGTGYNVITRNPSTGVFQLAPFNSGGVPGGSNTQIQYNSGGSFAGSANMTFDGTKAIHAGSTSDFSITAGALGLQSYAVNNSWLGENMKFNGTNHVFVANGYGTELYFLNNEMQYATTASSGTAGATATRVIPFKANGNGSVWLGGNISATGASGSGAGVTITGTDMTANGSFHSSGVANFANLSFFGSGSTVPGAVVDLVGASTSNASLRIRAGSVVTSPNNGDIYYDGTHLYFKPAGTQVDLLATSTIEGGSAITATGTSLGTNVTSVTASGKDRAFTIVVVTSGAVNGTIGHVTFSSFTGTPVVTISCADAVTGQAVFAGSGSYIASKGTSSTDAIFTGDFASAGTYTFSVQANH